MVLVSHPITSLGRFFIRPSHQASGENMKTLRNLASELEAHYVTCGLSPWACGQCRWIEKALT